MRIRAISQKKKRRKRRSRWKIEQKKKKAVYPQVYYYKGLEFERPWLLAYWIYCEDKKIDLAINNVPVTLANGEEFYYNFVQDGQYVHILNNYEWQKDNWIYLRQSFKDNNVKVLGKKQMKPILNFIYKKHGGSALSKHKLKTYSDFKRRVYEYDELTPEQFKKLKHKNVKFHYVCKICGKDEFTTWRLIDHFRDGICRHCRKTQMKNGTYIYSNDSFKGEEVLLEEKPEEDTL